MTFTWNPSQLGTSELQQIRAEIQDVDAANPLLVDEIINHNITVENNFWGACARCCEQISRLFLRKADVRLGRAMMITYTKAAEQYLQMAVALRKKALGTVVPYAGGISVSGKIALAQNTDLVEPAFTRTMLENPWTGGYSSDSLSPAPSERDDIEAFE